MLSDYEQYQLEEIETTLRESDPRLAHALASFSVPRSRHGAWLGLAWLPAVVALIAGWFMVFLVLVGPLLFATMLVLGRRWLLPAMSKPIDDSTAHSTWVMRFWP